MLQILLFIISPQTSFLLQGSSLWPSFWQETSQIILQIQIQVSLLSSFEITTLFQMITYSQMVIDSQKTPHFSFYGKTRIGTTSSWSLEAHDIYVCCTDSIILKTKFYPQPSEVMQLLTVLTDVIFFFFWFYTGANSALDLLRYLNPSNLLRLTKTQMQTFHENTA